MEHQNVNTIVAVGLKHLHLIDQVADALSKAGLDVDRIGRRIGVVFGYIDPLKRDALRSVEGVSSVSENRESGIAQAAAPKKCNCWTTRLGRQGGDCLVRERCPVHGVHVF